MLDVYGGEQGMNGPNGGMSPTSNPTKLSVKREYAAMNAYHSGITHHAQSTCVSYKWQLGQRALAKHVVCVP